MNFTKACLSSLFLKEKGKKYFLLATLALGLAACDKPNNFTVNVPPTDQTFKVLMADTSTVWMQTNPYDSIVTDALDKDVIGYFNDPVFGFSEGSIYAQLWLSTTAPYPSFTDNTDEIIDKVVFNLYYGGTGNYFGNPQTPLKFKVYPVTNLLSNDSAHWDNAPRLYNPNETIVSYDHAIKINTYTYLDSLVSVTITDPIFISKLMNAPPWALDNYTSPGWVNYYYGVAIVPDTSNTSIGAGALYYFLMTNQNSNVTVYYHARPNNTIGDTFLHSDHTFPFYFSSTKYSVYSHRYSPAMKTNIKDSFRVPYVYAEPLGGTRIKVRLPYLKNFNTNNNTLGLYQAELVFPVVTLPGDTFSPPPQLLLYARDSAGNSVGLNNDQGRIWYGGTYDPGTKSYNFVVTRYIQQLLNNLTNKSGFIDYGFNLFVPVNAPLTARRVVLSTQNITGNNIGKPKLILTYSKNIGK